MDSYFMLFKTKENQITHHKIWGDPVCNNGGYNPGHVKVYKPEKFPHSLDNFLIKIGKEQYAKAPVP